MNTLICIGGSSAKILEAVLHLCAAGLGPENLRILKIDPDGANGNARRTQELLDTYLKCHKYFAGKLGDLKLFGTKLDLFGGDDLQNGSPPEASTLLRIFLGYDSLNDDQRDVVHLFFTKPQRSDDLNSELTMPLDQGFRGHAAIGAAAMSLISSHKDEPPWQQVIEKINEDLGKPTGARVVVTGSVFGGTGASAIHPVVRFLRTIPDAAAAGPLKIGVVAMVPYFSFTEGNAAPGVVPVPMAAKSERFHLATRAAAEFYQYSRTNGDWPFNAMYWIGDPNLKDVKYAPGGDPQTNEAHFVDLLAALASLEFFENPQTTDACYYAGPKNQQKVAWSDLPLHSFSQDGVSSSLRRFLLAGAVHLGFCDPLLRDERIDSQPFYVPWYFRRFAFNKQRIGPKGNQEAFNLLTHYFHTYYLPWWYEIHQLNAVELFNRSTLGPKSVDLKDLASLDPQKPQKRSEARMDDFFTDMVQVPSNKGGDAGSSDYLALLTHAAERYLKREYKGE